MKSKVAVAWFLISAVAVHAQTAMDDSLSKLPAPTAKQIAMALVSQVPDRFSVQILRVKPAKSEADIYCGLLNLKNQAGAYVGFQPFTIDTKNDQVFLGTASRCEM